MFTKLASATILALLAAIAGCTTGPASAACRNDGECVKEGSGTRYCLQSRCVQCLGDAACGARETCIDGQCKRDSTAASR